jgi:hypothetical protein
LGPRHLRDRHLQPDHVPRSPVRRRHFSSPA